MISTVDSAAGLMAALKAAASGDTIRLAPGNYGSVTIKHLSFDGMVTVTSLDENNPAIFSGVHVSSVNGLKLSDLEIAVKPGAAWNERLYVIDSQNVILEDLNVHGPRNGATSNQALAFVRTSENVQVHDSEFSRGEHGLAILESKNVSVDGSAFHDIEADGIRVGGIIGSRFTNNTFTDFFPPAGVHADAIQLWTTNTDYSSRDIYIAGNVITRGSGEAVQGIFLRDQEGGLPFKNVVIEDNYLSGTLWRGISVSNADDVTIADNIVVGWTDQKTWIASDHTTNLRLIDNLTTSLNLDASAQLLQNNSSIIAIPGDRGAALLNTFLTRGSNSSTSNFHRVNGSADQDRLNGTADADRIDGLNGADYITGGAGGDWLIGGAGDDRLIGQLGNDLLEGGQGNDALIGGFGVDTLSGGPVPTSSSSRPKIS